MKNLFEEAEKARSASQFKKAQVIYRALLKKKGLGVEQKVEAYLGLADVERIQGFFPQALAHYQQAARLFRSHEGKTCWDAQVGWALAARACGRPQEALAVLQKALAAYMKEKDLQGQAFTHWALGGTWRIAGDMKKGLRELLTALRMFKSQKDLDGVAYTCCALGGIYRMLGRYADSGKYYREANRRMRALKDTFGIAYSYCGLGNVERMGGRFRQALPFYRKAERLYGAIGDRVSYAYTLWSIGTTRKMLGQPSEAAHYFFKADKLFIETGDTRGRLYVSQGLSELRMLAPLKSKLGRLLFIRQNKKENQIPADSFKWENLHERFLIDVMFVQAEVLVKFLRKKRRSPAIPPHVLEAIRNKASEGVGKVVKTQYQKAGSIFYPRSIPVNWP